ncbi:MAG: hypothetical protein U1E38_06495 [Rhodospirillales bacterium]
MSGPSVRSREPITDKRRLIEYLESACKPRDAWRIGTEHEKFAYGLPGLPPAPLRRPAEHPRHSRWAHPLRRWRPVTENSSLIALADDSGCSVTPLVERAGGAVEGTTGEHPPDLRDRRPLEQVKTVGAEMSVGFLGIGYRPKWPRAELQLKEPLRHHARLPCRRRAASAST